MLGISLVVIRTRQTQHLHTNMEIGRIWNSNLCIFEHLFRRRKRSRVPPTLTLKTCLLKASRGICASLSTPQSNQELVKHSIPHNKVE